MEDEWGGGILVPMAVAWTTVSMDHGGMYPPGQYARELPSVDGSSISDGRQAVPCSL